MLSRVTAKNSGDVFLRHSVYQSTTTNCRCTPTVHNFIEMRF